eukprot:CAMPEP_0117440060 /NCGR_PEP_ID=MMETSP0759-20121206/2882_1 /TAXON_ID=63605 /ORGANISM="Percolomonas cosmopolitus, Strain WS" /LENGTH=737 /DNA_ID=CAMNT_0005231787 /DNA_START=11 /DNA_END=2221 /DNA_ORIENTATION=+
MSTTTSTESLSTQQSSENPQSSENTGEPAHSYIPPPHTHFSDFVLPNEPETPEPLSYQPDGTVVWDTGSHRMRVGYATSQPTPEQSSSPIPYLTFKPHRGKLRGASPHQKSKFRGNEFTASLYTKLHARTAHSGEVVTNQGVMEDLLDYGWEVLGMAELAESRQEDDDDEESSFGHLASSQGIPNQCIFTESVCNPTSTRAIMSELLFEYYGLPSVLYGVDALFSLYNRVYSPNCSVIDSFPSHALIIRSGHHATHILPIVNQKLDTTNIKRLPLGGHHITEYSSKLIQNKYPLLKQYLTATATGTTTAELIKEQHMYVSQNYWEELQRLALDELYYWNHTHILQMPYTPQRVIQQKSAQEIQEQEERKKQRTEKLERLARERNAEKLKLEQETLSFYLQMKDMMETDRDTYSLWMSQYGFVTDAELDKGIQDIRGKQERREKRKAEKERRKQKLAQLAKDFEKQKSPMELLKEQNPQEWLKSMKQQRNDLKKQIETKKVDAGKASGSRGRRAASKKRLRTITSTLDMSEKETNFGREDNDWDVYREIGTSTLDTLESQEAHLEQMQDEIDEMELALFDRILSHEKRMHYMRQYNFLAAASSRQPNFSGTRNLHEAEFYQYQLTVERMRASEAVFEPMPLLGVKNCGLMEMVEICLSAYDSSVVRQMMQQVHLSGGNAHFAGMKERVESELRAMLQVDVDICVSGESSVYDAWQGASRVALDGDYVRENSMTRAEYD